MDTEAAVGVAKRRRSGLRRRLGHPFEVSSSPAAVSGWMRVSYPSQGLTALIVCA